MQIVVTPGMKLEDIEKMHILNTFKYCGGDRAKTAHCLGVSIRTIGNKLEQYKKEDEKEGKRLDEVKRQREEFQQRQRGIHPAQFGQASSALRSFDLRPEEGGFQSTTEVKSQSEMPLPERQEVQNVLPNEATNLHSQKSRRPIPREDGFSGPGI